MTTLRNTSVPFCFRCGSLLQIPECNPIVCSVCNLSTTFEETFQKTITTKSTPKPPPNWLVQFEEEEMDKLTGKKKRSNGTRAVVDQECPKCHHPQMEFYTMQLRSADEGATVFYECLNKKCRHKFNLNN